MIAALDLFSDVEACCLFGQPDLESRLESIASRPVFVVPLLMAEGYTYDLLAERLRSLQARLSQRVTLCRPVGSHPGVTDLITATALGRCQEQDWRPEDTGLVIIGHGTPRHVNSSRSLRHHAEAIDSTHRFAAVSVAFLDDAPRLPETVLESTASHLVAVGLFADAGPHGADDVSGLLAEHAPDAAYAGPVGCDPGLAALILDRVRQEDAATLAA